MLLLSAPYLICELTTGCAAIYLIISSSNMVTVGSSK